MSTRCLLVVTVGPLRAQTRGWVLLGGNWGRRGVDTSSCLQGWNKDLTPAAVQHRHQLGLEPEKMSFTSSINTAILSVLHNHKSLFFTFFLAKLSLARWWSNFTLSPLIRTRIPFSSIRPTIFFSIVQLSSEPLPSLLCLKHPSSSLACVPLSLPPYFPRLSLLPLATPFQWHTTDFLPTFLPSLNIGLCGTVALDFCDDFIPALLAWVAVNSSGEWGLLSVASAVIWK